VKSWFIPNTLPLVLGLGVNCTIGYGTVYYSFSLMSLEIENHFGWSSEFIFGIYSLGILLSGLVAPIIGRYLDLWGARYLMSFGSLAVACCFLGLSQMNSPLEFIFFLLLIEILLTLIVYESAFVALTQVAGKKARLPIQKKLIACRFISSGTITPATPTTPLFAP
jgi:MFS family permease